MRPLMSCLQNQFSEVELILGVEALKTNKDPAPSSHAAGYEHYFWSVAYNLNAFYHQLRIFLFEYNVSQRDLPHACVNCQQQPQESCSAYIRCFNIAWTEHAGLGTDGDAGILYVSTCLTNITTPEIMQKTPQDLAKWVRELEATEALVTKAPSA